MAPIWGFGLAFVKTTMALSQSRPRHLTETRLAPSLRISGTGMETLAPSFRSNLHCGVAEPAL